MFLIGAALGNQLGRIIILFGIAITLVGLIKYKRGNNPTILHIGLALFIGSFAAYLIASVLVFGIGSILLIVGDAFNLNIIQGNENELTPLMLNITEVVRIIILAILVTVTILKNYRKKY